LLSTERRLWPPLVLGGLAANLASDVLLHDKTFPVSLAFAAGNALEALAGAWLLQRWADTPFTLNRVKNVLALATLPALLSTMLSATVGATTIWATQGEVSWGGLWFVWWSADALGILLVTPALLALTDLRLVRPPEVPEWGLMIVAGRNYLDQWWMVTFPGLAILSLTIAFNVVGDSLRDLLDPRLRKP
jgi:integral membrane sensor domain MASE1